MTISLTFPTFKIFFLSFRGLLNFQGILGHIEAFYFPSFHFHNIPALRIRFNDNDFAKAIQQTLYWAEI